MSFLDLKDIQERLVVDGYRARFVHTDRVTIAFREIDAGSPLPEHAHPHEQTATVTQGEYELTVDGEVRVLRPGDVAVIRPHLPHSGRAITDCRITDVFCPVREDYR